MADPHDADGHAPLHASTNAFSKKVEQHTAAVALHFFAYNFTPKHQTLKGATPAVAAGVEYAPWSLTQIAELLD